MPQTTRSPKQIAAAKAWGHRMAAYKALKKGGPQALMEVAARIAKPWEASQEPPVIVAKLTTPEEDAVIFKTLEDHHAEVEEKAKLMEAAVKAWPNQRIPPEVYASVKKPPVPASILEFAVAKWPWLAGYSAAHKAMWAMRMTKKYFRIGRSALEQPKAAAADTSGMTPEQIELVNMVLAQKAKKAAREAEERKRVQPELPTQDEPRAQPGI